MSDDGEVDFGNEFPAHYKVMLDKLNEQRQLDQFTDITLIVDGHQFRAHKAVLAACSQFFHKFFQDFTLEPLVEIEGVSNSAFRHLMEFTYTAKLVVSGLEEVNDVWKAAEYLQMQEAIKALNNRVNSRASFGTSPTLTGKSKAKKRRIAETSNVITESLPSVETEPVEIEVEISEGSIEVEEAGLEEMVMDAAKNAQSAEGSSDDSALALLADITSKYQQGEPALRVVTKGGEEVVLQDESVVAPKALESIEVVEVQISQLDNMFRCDKCERSFKLFYHLKQHMRSHVAGTDKPYTCRHCAKAYAREGALKQHLNSCHFEAEEQSRRHRPQKKVHVCEYCDKQFDHFGHFKEHLRKHTGEKPFECPDCHERFARNSTLKCHMAACQNGCGAKKGRKKLYECQVCSSVFNSWDHFKDHLVIHTGEKPNHCTLCDLWFTQPRDLRTHLRDIHGATSVEEVLIAQPSPAMVAVVTSEEEAGALLEEDGMRVEHVTVEPVDVEQVEEAVVMDEDPEEKPLSQDEEEALQVCKVEEGEVTEVQQDDGTEVEIQVGQVTGNGEQPVSDLEVQVAQEQVETHMDDCEAQAVEV
ncbi:zinc finger protein 131 [Brienomyrus brachyistius]|uniref:zinc finger protein 131 n=1 Tax=Brienomyrus brachyistius TaxID=42636 RepID=UPI0020B24BC6|nr:zinc finger protein 131 [Brienomyrus brachyistius]XP_048835812.1 zinc finger protein 131 [Brienomyrus brachyistius]XP_048835821.1 zinc finger protein 131 [Brienomyrus brachyistius]